MHYNDDYFISDDLYKYRMNELLTITLNIFLLILIGALIEGLMPDNKFIVLLKPAISIAIILTVITYIKNIKLTSDYDFNTQDYSINIEEVWENQAKNCEVILEKTMLEDCHSYNLNIDKVEVDIDFNNNSFKINNIKISGKEKISAKNYISGKYNIGLAYISTDED